MYSSCGMQPLANTTERVQSFGFGYHHSRRKIHSMQHPTSLAVFSDLCQSQKCCVAHKLKDLWGEHDFLMVWLREYELGYHLKYSTVGLLLS
jgi:hypothetical protein